MANMPDFISIALWLLVGAEVGMVAVLIFAYIRIRTVGFWLILLAEMLQPGLANLLAKFIAARFDLNFTEVPPIATLILTARFLLFTGGCWLVVRRFKNHQGQLVPPDRLDKRDSNPQP